MQKVLVVNDSKLEGIIMKDALSVMGYEVLLADEHTALKKAAEFSPDFVVVNYIMKEISGDQLIPIIKLQNPKVRCLLCSSNIIDESHLKGKKIDAVFRTPVDGKQLSRIIESLKENEEKTAYGAESKSESTADQKVNSRSFTGGQEKVDRPNTMRFCPFCGIRLGTADDGKTLCCSGCGHKF